MANLPPEAIVAALQAAHKTGVATDPNAEGSTPSQGGGGAQNASQGSVDPTQAAGDPSQGDPNAQGQDPNEQAVWQEFPATDPQNIQALSQQMQGVTDPGQLVDLLGQFMQQADADTQKLNQMHEAMLSQLMDLLQGPGGAQPSAQDQTGPAAVGASGPGVGGQGSGY